MDLLELPEPSMRRVVRGPGLSRHAVRDAFERAEACLAQWVADPMDRDLDLECVAAVSTAASMLTAFEFAVGDALFVASMDRRLRCLRTRARAVDDFITETEEAEAVG